MPFSLRTISKGLKSLLFLRTASTGVKNNDICSSLLSVTHVREQTYSCVSPPVRVICLTCSWTGLPTVSLERRPVRLRDELQLDYEHSIISPRGGRD